MFQCFLCVVIIEQGGDLGVVIWLVEYTVHFPLSPLFFCWKNSDAVVLSVVMDFHSSIVILNGGIFALASTVDAFALNCSASTSLLDLMADSVAVIRFTTAAVVER